MTTPAGQLLAKRIQEDGPISFSDFMECALYHPVHGYYRRKEEIFGQGGDFYTAEQLQPVFGRLIAQDLLTLVRPGSTVLELGAGRAHMQPSLNELLYVPYDITSTALPHIGEGVIFSNEFFDAVPVNIRKAGSEVRVDFDGTRFIWTSSLDRDIEETHEQRIEWLHQIDNVLSSGFIYTIDYGYTRQEWARFPQGTLMSYRKHVASSNVLENPGMQDITAHVDFSALQNEGTKLGWETIRFETLAQTLLRIGTPDEFAPRP